MPIWLLIGGGIYFLIASAFWYVLHALTVFVNGGKGVFKTFLRDVSWHLPGGLKQRTAFIEKKVNDPHMLLPNVHGTIGGSTRNWDFDEIRQQNLYEECAKDVLSNSIEFWFYSIVVPLLWFIFVPMIVVRNLLSKEKDAGAPRT